MAIVCLRDLLHSDLLSAGVAALPQEDLRQGVKRGARSAVRRSARGKVNGRITLRGFVRMA
jgi:hypothetical protein